MARLGFDIDEVVFDVTTNLLEYVKNKCGVVLSYEDLKSYTLEHIIFSDKEEEDKLIKDDIHKTLKDINFQAKELPFPEAVLVLRQLKRQGHTLHYITKRDFGQEVVTIKIFRKHNIPFDSIHHTGYYLEKGPFARELRLDFYVDDIKNNLDSVIKYSGKLRIGCLLFDKPWNNAYSCGEKIKRIYNWAEINRYIGIHNR